MRETRERMRERRRGGNKEGGQAIVRFVYKKTNLSPMPGNMTVVEWLYQTKHINRSNQGKLKD